MTSASVLFYGNRRSRARRRSGELALNPSYSSPDGNRSFSYLQNSSSSNSTSGIRDITSDRRCNRFSSQNLRHNYGHDLVNDEYKFSRRSSQISNASSSEYEAFNRGHGIALPSVNISNREPRRHANSNSGGANRLPRPVVLAKERLVQGLRNASVSGTRQSRETSSSSVAERPDFWFADAADWEASILTEEAGHSRLSEQPSEIHESSRSRAPIKKPPGLEKEMLACLNHEVFFAVGKSDCEPISAVSKDCSICLDSFVEGNELTNLPCSHKFHTACLYPWIRTCGECPYCRTTIVLSRHRR